MASDLLPGYTARPAELMAARWMARSGDGVRAVLLVGPPGTGKTFFAHCLAKGLGMDEEVFVPCHPWLTNEEVHQGIDIGAVAVGVTNPEDAYMDGRLLQAIKATNEGRKVLVVLDEVEKAGDRFYPLILDFLQHGRVPDARGHLHMAALSRLWVVLTGNDASRIHEAVQRRCYRVVMSFLPEGVEADVLRKMTGAPGGACRTAVKLANAIRESGTSKPSLQELTELLKARSLCSSSEEMELLIRAFLVKDEEDWKAMEKAMKSPASALWGELKR